MKSVEPSIFSDWLLYILGLIGGACYWIVRKVLTNEKQVELLRQENEHSRQLRQSQDDAIQEIRKDQKKLVEHILKSK